MNKLKKSFSVLLTLVMLFTTLCFFVLPETGIKANARAEAQGYGSESFNPVSFTPATEIIYTGGSTSVSTEVKVTVTDANYKVRINSISAVMPYDTSCSVSVAYTAGTVVTSSAAVEFDVSATITNTTNSVIRYTFGYDILDNNGNVVYKNLTGYTYCGVSYYEQQQGGVGDANTKPTGNLFRESITNSYANFSDSTVPNKVYVQQASASFTITMYARRGASCVNLDWCSDGDKLNAGTTSGTAPTTISYPAVAEPHIGYSLTKNQTGTFGPYTWMSWTEPASGCYSWNYNIVNSIDFSDGSGYSNHTGSVTLYYLHPNDRATAKTYVTLVTRGTSDDMKYYVQKAKYTTESWNNFIAAQDAAAQVAYVGQNTSSQFQTACKDNGAAPTNLYNAYLALEYADKAVAYDSLFNIHSWNSSVSSSQLNNPSGGSITVNAANGTINIKSNSDVMDLYTNFEESGNKLSSNLYSVELEPNSEYMLLYKVQDGLTGAYQVMVFPFDEGGNASTFVGRDYYSTQDAGYEAGWRSISFSTAAAKIKATVRFGVTSAGSDVTFSDIHLVKIPSGETAATYAAYLKEIKYPVATTIVNVDSGTYGTLATPTRECYDFVGWFFADGTQLTSGTAIQDEGISVVSKWTPKKYTFTVEDGFGNVISTEQIEYLSTVNAPTNPTKEGYTFDGWDTSFPFTMGAANVTVKAKWKAKQFTVTFMDGDKTIQNITQDFGTAITPPADPTKTGYNFTGWNPEVPSTIPAKNTTVYAQWYAINYTITYDLNESGVLDAALDSGAQNTYTIEDEITLPSASSTNYDFVGWDVTSNENGNWVNKLYYAGDKLSAVYGNVTLKAKWEIKKFTVTWVNWNNQAIETDTVDYGTMPTFDGDTPTKPADAQFTYIFSGWDKPLSAVTADITYTAQFTGNTNEYTVIWYDHDGTELARKTYLYGATPEFPLADPTRTDPDGRYTYIFTGWSPAMGTVTGNASYTATYSQTINTFTVTFAYKDKDGNDKTATFNDVPYGTGFNSLVSQLKDFVKYYKGESTGFNHSHYQGNWINAVDAITKNAEFVAEYTLVPTVTMTFAEANKAADCENPGLEARECTFCGYYFEKEIPAKGHDPIEVGNSATCLEGGQYTYKCSRCDEITYKDSPAKGHSFTTATTETPATCITDGMLSYKTCVVCDLYFAAGEAADSANGKADTEDFKVKAEGHKFTLTTKTPATCEADGHEAYNTCSVCNLYFAENADIMAEGGAETADAFIINKLGHDYEKVVTEPTCTEEGYTTYTCKNDASHKYISDKVAAKGHTPGEPVYENVQNATCTNAGTYDEVVYCTVKNCVADVAANGYFQISRETKTTYLPHDYVSYTVTANTSSELCVAAKTCYSYAVYYKTCSMCGLSAKDSDIKEKTFEDVNGGKLEHTKPTEPVKENEITATCTVTAEWDDVYYCTVTECKAHIETVHRTGEKNPSNHSTHTATKTVINEKPGTCVSERTWTEVYTCDGCNEEINRIDRVGTKNVLNHTSEAEGEPYVDTAGTCISETVWRVDTICSACGDKTKTRTYKGEKNPDKHAGGTNVVIEKYVEGTCVTVNSWQVVTYCLGCNEELSRIDKTGNTDPNKHIAETYTKEENIVPGTCTAEKTWDVVTYCKDCNNEIAREGKIGEKDADNHSGTTELRNNKAATCGEAGYTGDLYWSCCDVLEAEGEEIPIIAEHTPADPVKENEIPATETTDGEYDSVVYCSVCHTELSREHIVHRIERTIRFVLKDKVIEVKGYSGDTVTAPETPEVRTEDGFWHYFMYWDKKIKPITGDATYTAIYTEPCDYTELERLEKQLNEILTDGSVSEETIEANREQIEETLAEIKRVYKDRNYRDVSEQNEITEVTDMVDELIQIICPDLGSTLVLEGSAVQYTGRTVALRAVKMPSGTEIADAQWTSSDDSIVFFANGKLYAIGTGTVTITAKRGILEASRVITIVEGGNARGINFTSVDNTSFILEDTYETEDGAIVFWADDQPIRFRVQVNSSFLYETYYVYINGEAAETDIDGYYTIPANSGDVKVTIAGEMIDTGAGEGPTVTKWSFWDWLMSFFRKIGDFFKGLFS